MVDENNENKLLEQVGSIAASLKEIALLRAVDAFYSRNERAQLIGDYLALRDADDAAFKRLREADDAGPEPKLGWEARVQKYGEEEAQKQRAGQMAALDARRMTIAKVEAFERRHPLIERFTALYPFYQGAGSREN